MLYLLKSHGADEEGNYKYGNTKLATMPILPILCVREKLEWVRLQHRLESYMRLLTLNRRNPVQNPVYPDEWMKLIIQIHSLMGVIHFYLSQLKSKFIIFEQDTKQKQKVFQSRR